MRLKISLLFVLFAFLSGHGLVKAGGPWTLQKGKYYGQLSFTFIQSNKLFNGTDPAISLRRDVRDMTVQGFAEYGITDYLTVFGSAPYKMVATGQQVYDTPDFPDTLRAGDINFFGNPELGARVRLINKKVIFSGQFKVEANTSDLNNFNGLQTGFNSWAFTPSLLLGVGKEKWYFSGELGASIRNNQHSERMLGNTELGYRFGNFWLIGVLSFNKSFYNGDYCDCQTVHTGLYLNDQEDISYGLKTILPVNEKFGFNLSVFGSFYANMEAKFPSVTGGFYFQN